MTETIVVVDYGAGNLHSAAKALEHAAAVAGLRARIVVSGDASVVRNAQRIVLPGQGSFGDCINAINTIPGLRAALDYSVIERSKPFLGICVGMQLMARIGHEDGHHEGLGWIPGEVSRMAAGGLKIPHMGWNELVRFGIPHPVTAVLTPGDHAYFVHSYQFVPDDMADLLAYTEYGSRIPAIIGRRNMVGMQFHPEKSQDVGLKLITAFLRWHPE
jgi:glutamine amidotransferase